MIEAIASWDNQNFHWSRDDTIRGYIYFQQTSPTSKVHVTMKLSGLVPGYHGVHVHELPLNQKLLKMKDCCNALKGHFNPYCSTHGSYKYNTERHVGDLINNLIADTNGNVDLHYVDDLISLYPQAINNIVGRSIVIHEDRDDEGIFYVYENIKNKKEREKKMEDSLTSGNAGKRIGCSNIHYL